MRCILNVFTTQTVFSISPYFAGIFNCVVKEMKTRKIIGNVAAINSTESYQCYGM